MNQDRNRHNPISAGPENRPERERSSAPSRRRKGARRSRIPLLLFAGGIILLAGILTLLMILLFGGSKPQPDETRDGIAFLTQLEKKDPAAIDETLAAIHKQQLQAQCDAILNNLLKDQNDVWPVFEDYAILGDSRAWGFAEFGFLDRSRILAAGGDNIRMIMTHLEELKTLRPSYIFLCYGMNDMGIGYWDNAEDYIAEYMQTVADLQKELPDSKIFVNSILPAREAGIQLNSVWSKIPAYNDKLRQTCKEAGVLYVDNTEISEAHAELWDPDGLHVRREFYPYWGRNMIIAMIEVEIDG